MALGKTNQEIARQFVVALGTIKSQAASIYRKLDVANRTEAVHVRGSWVSFPNPRLNK